VVAIGAASLPARGLAADPPAVQAAEHLARTRGMAPAEFSLLYERTAPAGGLWAGKFADAQGNVSTVYRDAAGRFGGTEVLVRSLHPQAAGSALQLKADAALRARVAEVPASTDVGVAVWLDVDAGRAVESVIAAHPELAWDGDRPLVDSLEAARAIRAELWNARRAVYEGAAEAIRPQIEALGGTLAYVSPTAPLVFVDLPAGWADALAGLERVETLGLERSWMHAMSTAGPTVDANWTTGSGDQGNGVRVAVVEYHNVRNTGDMSGKVVASHSSSGTLAYASGSTFDHPTWVAGAIAGSGSYPGTAPGSRIVTASTGGGSASLARDRAVIATTDWAISPSGGDADIVNVSLVQDTSTGSEEARRYFDSVVSEDLRVVVASAGNYSALGTWRVGSPGTGWNVLTVGGTDDRNTSSRGDDRFWYLPGSNGSSYVDPPGTAWNPHGDFNKPNVSAPAVGVRTSNGLAATGTSVSSPIVSGIVAQLLSRAPTLAAWPEALRAVTMAGAIHHTRMPNGSIDADHEGVGSASAMWANRILVAGDGTYGGYRHAALNSTTTQSIQVASGQALKVVLAWNSRAGGSSNLAKTDTLASDLDLRIRLPNGTVIGSYSLDNSYEHVQVTSPTSGTAVIEVIPSRLSAGSQRFALAWSKVGGDGTAPAVTSRAPADREPWAPSSARLTVSFSEPVTGLVSSSVVLTSLGSGSVVSAGLSYNAAARRLTISPGGLAPGGYRLSLTNAIRDLAGNRLAAQSTTFTVIASGGTAAAPVSPQRTVAFAAGSHVGYRFDSAGNVTASKAATLPSASGALAGTRATIAGRPGHWLAITNGIWAGYWIRESSRAGIRGTVDHDALPATTRLQFAAGSHTGYRFGSNGSLTASKTATLSAPSGANVSARAMINGSWHHWVTNGIWAGYWMRETSRAYVLGMRDHRDLLGRTTRFASGTYVGHRWDSAAAVIGSRSGTLASSSGAPAMAWAIINGAPRYLIGAGVWAGHWVPESTAVTSP
jgi:Subtilase family/Bacterial Ig-like domain